MKDQLAANIVEDIEKQESWQSYTTLLFADAEFREKYEHITGKSKKISSKDNINPTQYSN